MDRVNEQTLKGIKKVILRDKGLSLQVRHRKFQSLKEIKAHLGRADPLRTSYWILDTGVDRSSYAVLKAVLYLERWREPTSAAAEIRRSTCASIWNHCCSSAYRNLT
jgi:hypothetical protein